jgi:hypothetical protein
MLGAVAGAEFFYKLEPEPHINRPAPRHCRQRRSSREPHGPKRTAPKRIAFFLMVPVTNIKHFSYQRIGFHKHYKNV